MSLSVKQKEDTRRKLKEKLDKSGVAMEKATTDFGTTEEYKIM